MARQGQEFLWQPNRRRFGQQETTFWNYKLNGRYLLPFGFATGVSYKLQSGYNVARTITVPLPNAGNEVIHAHSLKDNRADNVHIVDYRFEKSIDLGGRRGKLVGLLDIFNAFNSDTIVNYRVITGPAYNQIIALLDPRMIRFGVRWDF